MTNMTKLNRRLLMGLAVTLSLMVAITVVHAQRQNELPPEQLQGGADSPERQAVQNVENTPQPAAHDPQTCVNSPLLIPVSPLSPIAAAPGLTVVGPVTVVLTFSSEIVTTATSTVNLDYMISGVTINPVPIGPEFFAHDFPFFVTRTAQGVTGAPFVSVPAGVHVITPFLRAFGGGATAFFRCFTAVPVP